MFVLLSGYATNSTRAWAEDPAAIDFFETSIRPLLADRCFSCHGPKQQWASLRLDSAAGTLAGGDTGPAVVPGKPEESELLRRVQEQDDDLRMPPADAGDPLSAEQIAVLTSWIRQGAIWPAEPKTVAPASDVWKNHWAFQPVRRPALPDVKQAAWVQQPIDQFVLHRLEAVDLVPSPAADRRTLIRRVSYDLTGLPPSPTEVAEFVADPSPDAYERLVERLLASPRYGEKWGRHWLDIARYSDTKGYVYAREQRFFVQSAAYRDWVIAAMNKDLPYDQFLLLQLAADQVACDDSRNLAAMGYLTLGRRFLGVTPDIIDDRIDVVGRGLLGLTVSCARCHDHKYDPIPTAHYYSLYGVFQNCSERVVPIDRAEGVPAPTPEVEEALKAAKQAQIDTSARLRAETEERARRYVQRYLLAQHELEKYPDLAFNQLLQKDDLIPLTVWQWEGYLRHAAEKRDPVLLPWVEYAKLKQEDFSAAAEQVTAALKTEPLNPLVAALFEQSPASLEEVAARYAKLLGEIETEWKQACEEATKNGSDLPASLADAHREAVRQVLYGARSPCVLPDEAIVDSEYYYDIGSTTELWKMQNAVDQAILQTRQSLPHAVVLQDRQTLVDPYIFRRGNTANKGAQVPRQFLEVIAGPERQPFQNGSGRLEMAQAIVAPTNPLTARVWVNRVWLQLFGTGLVNTPSDFGIRAEAPSHPELLDWLASEFVAQGWSTKHLIRAMLLSATYRQQSLKPADASLAVRAQELDPENRLLWRTNAKRLSFEQFRDTLITVAGQLNETPGGPGDDLFPAGGDRFRRSVYGTIDRQFLPNVTRVFDFANPDLHSPQRSETTIPQQALFALNHPFVAARAKAIAQQLQTASLTEGTNTPEINAALTQLYQRVLQRDPRPAEVALGGAFLMPAGDSNQVAKADTRRSPWSYGFGAIDVEQKLLQGFEPIPYLSSGAWQGGPSWPDAKLGWVQLTPTGGHPGNDLQHAVIRRWTAAVVGQVNIKSEIAHEQSVGDGIRYWVFSSRHGVLKSGPIHHSSCRIDLPEIQVEPGDTLDFVVDILENLNSDQFLWSPVVTETCQTPVADQNAETVWEAAADFPAGMATEMTRWEQLAQLLLLSNELMFID